MSIFNTEDAAKILSVNVSTIKRWSAAGKLKCIKSAGGHRKFEMQHLSEFIEKYQKKGSSINAFAIKTEEDAKISEWILKRDYPQLITNIYKNSLRCNRLRVLDILKAAVFTKIPLHELYDRIITPVLHNIGQQWLEKQLTVTEEHFASQTIKDALTRLQSIIAVPEKKLGIVMCMNFQNEMHDIALKMVDHILEYRGFKVLYSGQLTPLGQLENIFENYAPHRLYLSSTYVENVELAQLELDEIFETTDKYSVDVMVGGQGFNLLKYDFEKIKYRLENFKDVYEK